MGFWTTSHGEAKGEAVHANVDNSFEPIPNNTCVTAMIKEIKKDTYNNGPFYFAITWKIIGDKYNGRLMWQNLHINHETPKKRDRAVEMIARIFMIANVHLPVDEPTKMELMTLYTTMAELKIMQFAKDNGEVINWIASVNQAGEIKSGSIKEALGKEDVIAKAQDAFTDDIPF